MAGQYFPLWMMQIFFQNDAAENLQNDLWRMVNLACALTTMKSLSGHTVFPCVMKVGRSGRRRRRVLKLYATIP